MFTRYVGTWIFVPWLRIKSLNKLILSFIFIILKFKLWNTSFPQMIGIVKENYFHHSGEQEHVGDV